MLYRLDTARSLVPASTAESLPFGLRTLLWEILTAVVIPLPNPASPPTDIPPLPDTTNTTDAAIDPSTSPTASLLLPPSELASFLAYLHSLLPPIPPGPEANTQDESQVIAASERDALAAAVMDMVWG